MINNKYMKTEQYYTLEEVASILKVAYITVYRWVRAERLKALKAGKQYRITKTDLDSFLQVCKEGSGKV